MTSQLMIQKHPPMAACGSLWSIWIMGSSLGNTRCLPFLQNICHALPDEPTAIGSLDPDTALSHRTWEAARAGAGACCRAVDCIMNGSVPPWNPFPPHLHPPRSLQPVKEGNMESTDFLNFADIQLNSVMQFSNDQAI